MATTDTQVTATTAPDTDKIKKLRDALERIKGEARFMRASLSQDELGAADAFTLANAIVKIAEEALK